MYLVLNVLMNSNNVFEFFSNTCLRAKSIIGYRDAQIALWLDRLATGGGGLMFP